MAVNKVFDGLLVLQYKSGDKKALGLLVKRYHAKFCKHAYWYTKDIDASKDIAQDSWRAIINSVDKLKDENSFGSWSLTIVTRKSLDYLKQNQLKIKREKELYTLEIDSDISLEDIEENIREVKNEILKLTDNQKVVLQLFYVQEYSLREISEILSISEGTVKSRLFNAREKLKSLIKNK